MGGRGRGYVGAGESQFRVSASSFLGTELPSVPENPLLLPSTPPTRGEEKRSKESVSHLGLDGETPWCKKLVVWCAVQHFSIVEGHWGMRVGWQCAFLREKA